MGILDKKKTLPFQTHINPEQISNNVQNSLSTVALNIDPQCQPVLDEINEMKERVLVEWIKVQNIEISERNSLPKIRNTSENQSAIPKINIVVKNIIYEQKPDLISLNHLTYASAVISTSYVM